MPLNEAKTLDVEQQIQELVDQLNIRDDKITELELGYRAARNTNERLKLELVQKEAKQHKQLDAYRARIRQLEDLCRGRGVEVPEWQE